MIAFLQRVTALSDKDRRDFSRTIMVRGREDARMLPISNGVLACCPSGHVARRLSQETDGDALLTHAGYSVAFNGQLANRRALAKSLSCTDASPARVYAAALARWGDDADQHLTGHYCAIAIRSDGSIRLARSPFAAPPLHFRRNDDRIVASCHPRSLFWREDAPRRLDLLRLSQTLVFDFSDRFAGPWEHCFRVPLGSAVTVQGNAHREVWRYDLFAAPKVRFSRDEDYIEAALALFDEAVGLALEGAERPAVLLSGGLDSASVAASAVRQLTPNTILRGYTLEPEDGWDDRVQTGRHAREFRQVKELAELYPNLKAERLTGQGLDLRYRHRDLMQRMDQAVMASGFGFQFVHAYDVASEAGCDVMLVGDSGNLTFSNSGVWAFVEYFLKGRWGQLWKALRDNPFDFRPMWRRFAVQSLLPLLPDRIWRRIMRLRPGGVPDWSGLICVSPEWIAKHDLLNKAAQAGAMPERPLHRRREDYWISTFFEQNQEGDEYLQGIELEFGIVTRDPTAYRPLAEFCYGLPTDQYLRDGVQRRLAREMGRGRLPDSIRLERSRGVQAADWQQRVSRIRGELIEEIDRFSDDADIAAVIDLPRIRQMLTEMPAEAASMEEMDDHAFLADSSVSFLAIPMAISTGRYIAYAKGRNDI